MKIYSLTTFSKLRLLTAIIFPVVILGVIDMAILSANEIPKILYIGLVVPNFLLLLICLSNSKSPTHIILFENDRLLFKNYVFKRELSIDEIISIKSGTGNIVTIKCRSKSFDVINNFTGFYELLGYLKLKNPNLIIYGI